VNAPAPSQYHSKDLVNNRFKSIGFGYGKKLLGEEASFFVTKTPGPGEYKLAESVANMSLASIGSRKASRPASSL